MVATTRETRAVIIGQRIDEIFRGMGIDPACASLSAFALETFGSADFGRQMLIRRVDKNINLKTLADKLGYDAQTIREWERGLVIPKLSACADWAESLGLDLTLSVRPREPKPRRPRPKIAHKPSKPRKRVRVAVVADQAKSEAGAWLRAALTHTSPS